MPLSETHCTALESAACGGGMCRSNHGDGKTPLSCIEMGTLERRVETDDETVKSFVR